VIFTPTELQGAVIVDLEKREDDRGFFARAWCRREFEDEGLTHRLVQCNLSYNHRRGTLRGLHYQAEPRAEVKLVRCTHGVIYDVIVDLRPRSATFMRWIGVELTAENGRMLYVPEGFAHGYQTLANGTEVFYQVSEFYTPEAERGLRWDDPAFAIEWPAANPRIMSEKDRNWPDYDSGSVAGRRSGVEETHDHP
jgi:dTDP-4-dehydrorhamnose 3,5-epimerase